MSRIDGVLGRPYVPVAIGRAGTDHPRLSSALCFFWFFRKFCEAAAWI